MVFVIRVCAVKIINQLFGKYFEGVSTFCHNAADDLLGSSFLADSYADDRHQHGQGVSRFPTITGQMGSCRTVLCAVGASGQLFGTLDPFQRLDDLIYARDHRLLRSSG